ncbi:MAG: NUMOD4 domain-containing protein [bacterium]
MGGRYTAPEPARVERWRDVPGYDGKYQASTEGNIRRKLEDGTTEPVTIYDNRCYRKNYFTVNLTRPDGRRQERHVLRVVAETWFPDQLQGRKAAHRNGLKSDNSVWNVVWMTRKAIGQRLGGQYGRKPVLHYRDGKFVELYPSIIAASLATGYSIPTITSRCNGVMKAPCKDGSTFTWDRG